MMIIPYLVKMTLATGLLYAYYRLFLRNREFHRYNRFYLLFAVLATFIVPLISIPLGQASTAGPGLVRTLQVIQGQWGETDAPARAPTTGSNWLTASAGAWILYALGAAICLTGSARALLYIGRVRRKYPCESIGKVRFYNTSEPGTPFSFFRLIFWNRDIPLDDEEGRQIFRHEMYHVRQRHSSDILFLEILSCIAWFNPFLRLIKREMRTLHEFLADEYAVSQNDRFGYADLLVSHAIRQKNTGFAHPFSQHEIKRRILMITRPDPIRRNSGTFSRVMGLPLLLVLCSAFAVRFAQPSVTDPVIRKAFTPLIVIIDAGHGGIDPGAWVGDLKEKDITLALAQKIGELSAQYGVQVALTRNSDVLPGNAADVREGLEKRVEITKAKNADLLISLHVNSSAGAKDPESGFVAFISKRRPDRRTEAFATTLLEQMAALYKTSLSIRQRDEGLMVLDKTSCPAVIMECGNLDLPGDRIFITDKTNQEKVARNILQGIVRYQQER